MPRLLYGKLPAVIAAEQPLALPAGWTFSSLVLTADRLDLRLEIP